MALKLKPLVKLLFTERRGEVRATLRDHLASGKKLNAEGYWLLLATYDAKGKPPPELATLIDELLCSFETPAGKRLLAHDARLKLLKQLALHLLNARRWREAFDMHVRYYEDQKTLSKDMHATLLRTALKLDGAALVRAWAIHQKLAKKNRGWVDFPAIKREVKKVEAALGGVDTPTKVRAKENGDLTDLIAAIHTLGAARSWDGEIFTDPKPLNPRAIAKLRIGRKKVPPSLSTWLSFDASWLPIFSGGKVDLITLEDFFAEYAERIGLDAGAGKDFASTQGHGLKASTKILVLPESASQSKLLIGDRVDARGEMPVFSVEKEEAFPSYESFGEFIVDYLSATKKKPAKKKPAKKKPAKKK